VYSPTNADYLNELTFAYDNANAKASVVSAINIEQQYVAQMGMYSGLAAGNMVVLRNVMTAQSLVAQAKAGSLALSAQLDSGVPVADSVQVTLEDFASTDTSTLINPITVETVEVYGQRQGIDFALPALIALIAFQSALMGMGRAIAGERHDGSLTRVFLTPTSNITILLGTQLFYMIFETLRAVCIVLIAMLVFGLTITGNPLDVVVILILFTMGATGVGLVLSSMAKTEEQFMPMSMLVSLPSMFLAGAFFPIQTMPAFLQGIAKALPIYYAGDALRGVMVKGFSLMQVLPDMLFLLLFALGMLVISTMVFKREVM
jgi:ABC-2 type transport system permease protein